MKTIKINLSLLFSILYITHLFGQNPLARQTHMRELPIIYLYPDNSVHFLSPQPIKYVDISSELVHGDLPLENMLRIKFQNDSLAHGPLSPELGTLTIVVEDFVSQYRLCYLSTFQANLPALIELDPNNSQPLEINNDFLTEVNKREISMHIFSKKKSKPITKKKDFGITLSVNEIYAVGEYIFLDISFSNDTKLSYDIDEFRFFVEDKKVLKTTNFQSIEISPIWKFKELSTIKSRQRNIYVIKKVIFPNSKVLKINLTEKQISGRMLDLNIGFDDISNAKSL